MRKSKSDLVQDYYNAGYSAYHAGCSREVLLPDLGRLQALGLDTAWKTGWDTGLFEDAMKAGAAAAADAVCPYVHPEPAAYWAQGWRTRHLLTVIDGDKKPASRSADAKPGR